MNDRQVSELFVAVADWCKAIGVSGRGFHKFDGPDGLTVSLNTTSEEHESVPPLHAAIFANGWPAAVIHPFGGGVIGIGGWDEARMIAAFKRGPREATREE